MDLIFFNNLSTLLKSNGSIFVLLHNHLFTENIVFKMSKAEVSHTKSLRGHKKELVIILPGRLNPSNNNY